MCGEVGTLANLLWQMASDLKKMNSQILIKSVHSCPDAIAIHLQNHKG
jgi:hypothetical protein